MVFKFLGLSVVIVYFTLVPIYEARMRPLERATNQGRGRAGEREEMCRGHESLRWWQELSGEGLTYSGDVPRTRELKTVAGAL